MKTEDFNLLLDSIKEAGEIKRGEKLPSRKFVLTPPDIVSIRKETGVTQEVFAAMIGVSVYTLRNWEQGRRKPEGPALALLTIASKDPNYVAAILRT